MCSPLPLSCLSRPVLPAVARLGASLLLVLGRGSSGLTAAAFVLLYALSSASAQPEQGSVTSSSDGAYGRFDRDLQVAIVLGGGARSDGSSWTGAGVLELRPRWLDAAGPFFAARWGPAAGADLAFGLEMRPLWPALFLLDLSTGIEWLDLSLQSLGLDLGMALSPLGAGSTVGIGFVWGLGLELPLLVPSLSPWGPWLRLAFRHTLAQPATVTFGNIVSASDAQRPEILVVAALVLKIGVPLGFGHGFR